MTKDEAYTKMQHGYPVSHVNFPPNEFLWMDEDYIIRDENGDAFENSWDVNNTNEWDTGWYIFKNKTKIITTKAIPFRNAEESYITEKQLISHIGGTQCAGKEKCLQYHIIGESACLLCDCTESDRLVDPYAPLMLEEFVNGKDEEILNYVNSDDNNEQVKSEPVKDSILKRIVNKFKSLFRRKK